MGVNLHGISQQSFDHIIASEVSNRLRYDKTLRRPVRPGGASGITVGFGYDLAHATPAQIRRDWLGKIDVNMIEAMVSVSGLSGAAAQNKLASVRSRIDIPWEAAMAVFSETSLPLYLGYTEKGLPNFEKLSPTCKGVLTSLVYNRGASFSKKRDPKDAKDRYREMRAIKAHMASERFDLIPAELRSMSRLWTTPDLRGLPIRRETEAKMFERGLKEAA